MTKYLTQRPYPVPEPRLFSQWCIDLGLQCTGYCPADAGPLTFDEFHVFSDVKFYKVAHTPLYGFWRKYGDVWAEDRTVQEWLDDYKQELVDPTEQELSELNLYLGWDGFMEWSSGIIANKKQNKLSLIQKLVHRFKSR